MSLKITNETQGDLGTTQKLATDFFPYAKERMGFDQPVSLIFKSDSENAKNPLGMTGHYSPNMREITIYVDGRHPKDMLRTFSHELVHHTQNCRGEFDNTQMTQEGYAQKDKHLREMEKEAYLESQIILRDWEDSKKGDKQMNEESLRELVKEVFQKAAEKISLQEKTKTATRDRRGTAADGTPSDRIKGQAISEEADSKPDFLDIDKDGDKEESMKSAADDKVEEVVSEETIEEMGAYSRDDDEAMEEAHCGKRDDEMHEQTLEEETVDETVEEEVVEEEVVEEEDTVQEWKNKTLYENLIKKWCK